MRVSAALLLGVSLAAKTPRHGSEPAATSTQTEGQPVDLRSAAGSRSGQAATVADFVGRHTPNVFLTPVPTEPTLHGCPGCTDDRVLVDKLTYRFRDPAPGDVVVFRGTDSWASEFASQRSDNVLVCGLQQAGALIGLVPPDEKDLVKRVIAVGGQTVQCCDKQNGVMVNGTALAEPYAAFIGHEPQSTFGPVTVPQGNLWVMGDNRNNSADSRAHVGDQRSGTVPVNTVVGKTRASLYYRRRAGRASQTPIRSRRKPRRSLPILAIRSPAGRRPPAELADAARWPVVAGVDGRWEAQRPRRPTQIDQDRFRVGSQGLPRPYRRRSTRGAGVEFDDRTHGRHLGQPDAGQSEQALCSRRGLATS